MSYMPTFMIRNSPFFLDHYFFGEPLWRIEKYSLDSNDFFDFIEEISIESLLKKREFGDD